MNKFLKTTAFVALIASVSACNPILGEKVEVPPASVGMVYGKNGYEGDVIPPSRFRLDACFANCDKLVIIEAGDIGLKESMTVLMPKDNLDLGVDVRFTLALSQKKQEILSVFDRVVPVRLQSGNYGTTLNVIYNTYGAAVVRNVVRSELSKMSIAEIADNQEAVSVKLHNAVQKALGTTPLEIKQFGLANIKFPDVVTAAREATQKRLIEIEQADADAQVRIKEAQAQLEVTRAQRDADILAAETIAEQNKILAEGVTPEVIRYMELEVLKEMAKNENTVFFPVEMLGSDALDLKVLNSTK